MLKKTKKVELAESKAIREAIVYSHISVEGSGMSFVLLLEIILAKLWSNILYLSQIVTGKVRRNKIPFALQTLRESALLQFYRKPMMLKR